MNLSDTTQTVLMVVLIGITLVANFFIRRRRMEKTPLGKVASVLSEVDGNLKLAEAFGFRPQSRRFKISSWKRNKAEMEFLPTELQSTLASAFALVEDANQRIDSARKFKSVSYMASINVDRLKEPLAKSRQALQDWLKANMSNPAYAPKRRGMFS